MADPPAQLGAGRRVLIVTPQPFYEDRGTPIAIRLVIQALTELGYTVDVLAFPVGETIVMPGLTIHRTANPFRIRAVPIGFSWRKLLLDGILLGELWRLLAKQRYDCIHAVEEAAYLCLVRNRQRVPFVYDMASSIPAQLAERGLFSRAWIQRALGALEQRVLKQAARVLCSKGLEGHVAATAPGVTAEPWAYPPSSTVRPGHDPLEIRHRLKIPESAKIVLYAGSFADYQGLDVLIDAIPLVSAESSNVFFICVGGTAGEIDLMNARIDPCATAFVRLVTRQPIDEVGAYLACADVLVSTRRTGANLPLKIFDYLATAKPVLVSRGPAHSSVLDHDNVYAFDHAPAPLAQALLAVLGNDCRTSDPRDTATASIEEHWNAFRLQLADVYVSALDHSR